MYQYSSVVQLVQSKGFYVSILTVMTALHVSSVNT